MSCTLAELFALAAVVMMFALGLAGTWTVSGFLKDIELRHPYVYERLGRPSPQRTSDSDSHSLALLRFLLTNEYKAMQDPKLLMPARLLKAGLIVSSAAIFAFLATLCFVPSVQDLATLACIRGGYASASASFQHAHAGQSLSRAYESEA